VYLPQLAGHCSGSASNSNDGFPLAVPWTDAIEASGQQVLLLNPQGTVALTVGEAIGIRTAVGGVVVVAVSPSVILPLDTVGAVPLAVSSPSAVAKAPAATSAAPATNIARIFVGGCMNVPPGLCGAPSYDVRMC
jgi:hypothetical protein